MANQPDENIPVLNPSETIHAFLKENLPTDVYEVLAKSPRLVSDEFEPERVAEILKQLNIDEIVSSFKNASNQYSMNVKTTFVNELASCMTPAERIREICVSLYSPIRQDKLFEVAKIDYPNLNEQQRVQVDMMLSSFKAIIGNPTKEELAKVTRPNEEVEKTSTFIGASLIANDFLTDSEDF